jgi:alcohol dehydrogenase
MKQCSSLMLVSPRRLEWIQEELPPPGADELLVETVAGAVSLGSELPQFTGWERRSAPGGYPRMTGYESIGVVLKRGTDIQSLGVGDRVVAFYGHRTHAIVRESAAIPVPEEVPDEISLLAILTCDVAKGIGKVRPMPGDDILVTGAGALGLLTLFVLRMLGIEDVDVVEPRSERRKLAWELGARRVSVPKE